MIRLLVTDLDGTLLNSHKSISDYTISVYTISVLQQCRDAGTLTVFATARSLPGAAPYLSRFQPNVFIGYGGALTMENGKITKQFPLPFQTVQRLVKYCLKYPQITAIHANCQEITLTNSETEAAKDPAHYRYANFTFIPVTDYFKVSVRCSDPDVVKRIANHFSECQLQSFSGENFYTFASIEATKWNALKAVASSHSVLFTEIAAFGDDQNDLEMLRNCGYGVAMENAIPEVRQAARFSCPSNDEDGVAKWIEASHFFKDLI